MSGRSKEFDEGFYNGVIAAVLAILNNGQDVLAFEILRTCGDEAIRRIAKREGDLAIVQIVDAFFSAQSGIQSIGITKQIPM